MLVIGHRGANREALENSWSAFEAAVDAGASRIELDVQQSRDGHAVIMHEDSLIRTCQKPLLISHLYRAEIRELSLINGEAIPFLDEVIERFLPQVELNIEIKGPRADLAASVGALIKNHPLREKTIVSCFHIEPLEWFRDYCSEIKRACLLAYDHWNWPRFASHAPLNFLQIVDADILHPEVSLIDENFMDQSHTRGIQVFTWASMAGEENDREGLWTILKTFKVDGHCTNYPRQLKRWLTEVDEDEYRFDSR
jgi:glycerophosphoryl diester phosphodiesterase